MENIKAVKTAVVGCGAISGIYLTNLKHMLSIIDVVAVCDLRRESAETAAQKYGIEKVMSLEEILEDPQIELVVNLTGPSAHYSIVKQCLLAGKHVYTEKLLCYDLEQGRELLKIADEKKLYLGAAPDTFLGAGLQTARKVIDSGLIGQVTSAVGCINRNYVRSSESAPFLCGIGGGLPYDMGIYYTTALLSLLGPVSRVAGFGVKPQGCTGMDPSSGRMGEQWGFKSYNTAAVALQFQSGAVGCLNVDGASINEEQPHIAIYGTEGVMFLGDPNTFCGQVTLVRAGGEKCTVPFTHGYRGTPFYGPEEDAFLSIYGHRGIGIGEMAWAMRQNRPHRASKEMAFHAAELMLGVEQCEKDGRIYEMTSSFTRPLPLKSGFMNTTFEGKVRLDAEGALVQ